MSIRTNPMKAVPSLQKRLTKVKTTEVISGKLEELMLELENIKDLFSTVKRNELELLDTLKILDDLLRNFNKEGIFLEISKRILHPDNATTANREKGIGESSSSKEAEDKKIMEKDVTIEEKLHSLKYELDNMKAKYSTEMKKEELLEKFRAVEDLLRNFNAESLAEIKPGKDDNQSETKGLELPKQTSRKELVDLATGNDKSSSSQEAQDKTSVDKDIPIDEMLESLKAKLHKMKVMSSTVNKNEEFCDMLRAVEDLLRNFNAKSFTEIFKTAQYSNQSETKGDDDKPSSNQEAQDMKSVEKVVSIDEKLENLKSEIDNMKAKFSTVKKNEELYHMLRAVEDLLQNFKIKCSAEAKRLELSRQTSREELVDHVPKVICDDKPSSSQFQEAQHKKAKSSTMEENKEPSDKPKKEELMDQVVIAVRRKFKESTKKLGVSQSESESRKVKAHKPLHWPTLSLPRNNDVVTLVLKRFQAGYDALNLRSKVCCLSLSVFPENDVMKKRHVIYWWIGEGFVENAIVKEKEVDEDFVKKTAEKMNEEGFVKNAIVKEKMVEGNLVKTTEKMNEEGFVKNIKIEKTAEEQGEVVFDDLLNSNMIVPHGNGKCPIVNKFKINPWIRHMLVSSVLGENKRPFGFFSQITPPSSHHDDAHACLLLDQKKVKISGEFGSKFNHWRSVFNLGASYLNIEPQWMAKMKKLLVLQLGRWQESPSHHIEVDSVEFLEDLQAQKHLKYLSLRGISRITELPRSIAQLISLQILDLKFCHNLETLPNEITLLKKLTHLDMSGSYLLESIPKGIEKLTELQVLKGFVVGRSNSASTIPDLAKLEKLKRLSIHIGSEAVIQEGELQGLVKLSAVKCLKISWGLLSNTRSKHTEIILPFGLEKLEIEGFPSETTPEWLKPKKLPPGLKKLYINGGKLTSIGHEKGSSMSRVEIVRLKYLKNWKIKIDRKYLQEMFPKLKYAQVKQVLDKSFEWSIEDGVTTSMS